MRRNGVPFRGVRRTRRNDGRRRVYNVTVGCLARMRIIGSALSRADRAVLAVAIPEIGATKRTKTGGLP